MNPSSLGGVKAKLARAKEHLHRFQFEAVEFLRGRPHVVRRELDDEQRIERFIVERVDPVPVRLSVILGDVVSNLRSCIDHIAFGLWRTPPPDEWKVAFPIRFTPNDYAGVEQAMIGGADIEAKTIVEKLQPYHELPITERLHPQPLIVGQGYTPDQHPLVVLSRLANRDKHRALLLTYLQLTGGVIGPHDGDMQWGEYVEFEPGAEVGTFEYAAPAAYPEMRVEPVFMPTIRLRDAPFGLSAHGAMERIADFVTKRVVKPLTSFL